MRKYALLLVAAATLSACEDDATSIEGDLTAAEAEALADDLVLSTFSSTGDVATTEADLATVSATVSAAIQSTTEFTITRSCPMAGQVVLEGTRERTWDRETRSGSSDLALTKTHVDCARALESGVEITLAGAPNIAVESHHEFENGRRSGLQTLSMEGAVDWETSDDRSGTCAVDVEASFDPDTRTRTVSGTICNRQIDRETQWEVDGD